MSTKVLFIDPEYEPSSEERQQLARLMDSPGFEVLTNIARAECARYDVLLKNLNPMADAANYQTKVLELHRQSKVASQVWTALLQRLLTEKSLLHQDEDLEGSSPENPLPDTTQGILE